MDYDILSCEYEGKIYYFNSRKDYEIFENDPDTYISKVSAFEVKAVAKPKVREALPSEYGLMVRSAIYGVEFKVRKDTKVAEYRGQTFYFDSRKELEEFLANPDKYTGVVVKERSVTTDEYGIVAISPVTGIGFYVDKNIISLEFNGKVYYFLSREEAEAFKKNPESYIGLAGNVVGVVGQPSSQPYTVEEKKEQVIVSKPQDEKIVTVEPKKEPVINIVITLGEEEKLVKEKRKVKGGVVIIRDPHPKELGKVAVSPVSKSEFIVSSTTVVVKYRGKTFYLKDSKELNIFLSAPNRY